MNDQFDELTKSMAQSVTRRAALKKFGVGLAGMALACLGLANKAEAAKQPCWPRGTYCASEYSAARHVRRGCHDCCNGYAPGPGLIGYYCQ